jgi:SAM-dependent methyltransferase
VLSDAENAALYDLLNPWDPESSPGDRFYHELVMAAGSVLDVGCGTGAMLAYAREHGHRGRLTGLDPDRAALERAGHRANLEWVEGRAADARWTAEFDLAIMTGHAFQCLVADDDLLASLAAIHAALRDDSRFAFETRHPQARAWLGWNPAMAQDITGPRGRPLRLWHEVESAVGGIVTFTSTTAKPDGTVLSVGRSTLRFLDPPALNAFLGAAGFGVEAQYGDWDRAPVTTASREIITIARR